MEMGVSDGVGRTKGRGLTLVGHITILVRLVLRLLKYLRCLFIFGGGAGEALRVLV
jgi:hypothetical protein